MKNDIASYLNVENWSPIVEASIEHAHVRNLHSLVLHRAPGMVRVYFADRGHELWKNHVVGQGLEFEVTDMMSVALHTHRQDIALVSLFGYVENITFEKHSLGQQLMGFEHRSAILTGKGGFDRKGEERFRLLEKQVLEGACPMQAQDFHTVFVPRGTRAAWLVVEGDLDASYDPTCYSNTNLERFNFDGLYVPMRPSRARDIVDTIAYERSR